MTYTRTAGVNANYKSKYTKLNLIVFKLNLILADRHFAQRDLEFNTETKFTITEQLQNTKLSKENITEILKKPENFWSTASKLFSSS